MIRIQKVSNLLEIQFLVEEVNKFYTISNLIDNCYPLLEL